MENVSAYPGEVSRRFERRPCAAALEYVMDVPGSDRQQILSLSGRAVDISEAGLGIETCYPLAPGHTLWFNGAIDKAGTVLWSRKAGDAYRAGIRFDTDVTAKGASTEDLCSDRSEEYRTRLDSATSEFSRRLEAFETRCLDPRESPEVLQADLATIIAEMMNECREFTLSAGSDKETLKSAQIVFREKTNHLISKSYAMNRTRVWPQGSQGDYKTLELAYKGTPLSEGLGYYLDLYMMGLPLADAVRNRIRKLEDVLREEIAKRERPALLNIACGSSRELMGLSPEITASGARITCIDTDNDALSFAQSRLAYTGVSDQIEFRKYNALRLFDYDLAMSDFGKQDVIYSVGLFDYLPSDFLVRMFRTLYRLLNDHGTLILAFKDAARYDHHFFHWLVDWNGFQQRGEEDFRKIIADAGIPHSSLTEFREENGIIVFYLATRERRAGG
jgi:SAM-dependent methyltransferase